MRRGEREHHICEQDLHLAGTSDVVGQVIAAARVVFHRLEVCSKADRRSEVVDKYGW